MVRRFPVEVLRRRLRAFQEGLRSRGVDAAMVRVKSTFTYLVGFKWLRPAMLVPADGDPVFFVPKGEEVGFSEYLWVGEVITFRDGGELMGKVSSTVRGRGFRVVGLEYGIERDAYILFYEMFKRLNPGVDVVDISGLVTELRMVKDEYELSAIRRAGELASKVMEVVASTIKPGVSETEVAAEAYYQALKLGSEEPKVHVNAGPHPRVHAEPLSSVKVREGTAVTVVLGIDYLNYYANISRTFIVGSSELGRKALKCAEEVYEVAKELTKPGVKPSEVMMELDKVYRKYGFLDNRVLGYLHSVGLQVEEPPITTIVPSHRFIKLREGMAVAMIHSPILIEGLGQVKIEDTFILGRDGLEQVTRF